MIILVTGGTGFIGSHLCEKLVLNPNNHVICLDNNFCGSLDNISHLRKFTNFEFIRHDVTQPIYIEVNQIYHLACPASPKNYQFNGIKTIKTNILGTLNMLGLAKRTGARILLSSTSEVYGDPEISPQTEEYWGNVNPIGIRSCYDEGKRLAETLMLEYHRNCQVDIRIARIFNTYGPRMRLNDGRVLPAFIGQALRGEDLTIFGDGSQTRSFCYVDDQVEGIFRLLLSDYVYPVNIGNPHEISIRDFAEEIIKLTKSSQKVIYKDLPVDDPMQRKPDITLAKKLLDWIPLVSRKDGMLRTFNYFETLSNEEL